MEAKIRKIIHIDMDAFYASVEQRDNPELMGKPVVVGRAEPRGVVAAASYEARKFGVRSAMPSLTAKQKCPGLIFVPARFDVYKSVSKQIRDIFLEYTDLVEPLSLDEAFLDVSHCKKEQQPATTIAKEIKARIKEKTGLIASAGVSINKFLAKIASDYDKPDGLYVITARNAEAFVEKLPVKDFFGVGKVTAQKMHKLGIQTGKDLKEKELSELVKHFGKQGKFFFNIARAIDDRPVDPVRLRKSVGAEITFDKDLTTDFEMITELYKIEKELMCRLEKNKFAGRTLTLKVKYADFKQISRSKTINRPIDDFYVLHPLAKNLLSTIEIRKPGIRLLGLSVSKHDEKEQAEGRQLSLDF